MLSSKVGSFGSVFESVEELGLGEGEGLGGGGGDQTKLGKMWFLEMNWS
jgi:hypothetical protein